MIIYVVAPFRRTRTPGFGCNRRDDLHRMRLGVEVTGSETVGSLKGRLWDGGLIPRSKKIQLL